MLIVSGFKVYSVHVEEVMTKHPDVQIIAIIGVPNPDRPGAEIVKAVIQLGEGIEETEEVKEKVEAPKAVKKDATVRFVCQQYPNIKIVVEQKVSPKTARDRHIKPSRGRIAQFVGNFYSTSDPKEIAAIKGSLSFEDGTSPSCVKSAAELMDEGLQVTLKGGEVSELIFFEVARRR